MSPSYTDKHRPGPGSGEQGKQARSHLAGFLGGFAGCWSAQRHQTVLPEPETLACKDSGGGIAFAWALGKSFQKKCLLSWALKDEFEFAKKRRGRKGPHYRQEFHTVFLAACFSGGTALTPHLCSGTGLRALWLRLWLPRPLPVGVRLLPQLLRSSEGTPLSS